RGRRPDLLRGLRGGGLHHRRVARHQRRRPDDVTTMKESTRVLIALAAAVVLGIAVGASKNDGLLSAADFLGAFGALWVNAIRMTVIPLVVSVLVTGVASAADVSAIGRLGGRTLI